MKGGPVFPSNSGGQPFPGQLVDPLPNVNNMSLDDILATEDEPNVIGGKKKCIFWQTFVRDHRPKLPVKMNNKIFSGVLDSGAIVKIITQKNWPPSWFLKKCSTFRNRDPVSCETKYKMHRMYWTRRTERKFEAICHIYCYESLGS